MTGQNHTPPDVKIEVSICELESTEEDGPSNTTLAGCYWNSCTNVALSGAIILAFSSVFVKELSTTVSSFQIIFFRSLLAISVFFPVNYIKTGYVFGPWKSLPILFLRGLCTAIDSIMVALTYNFLPLIESGLLTNCHPVILFVLQSALGKEEADILSLLGVSGTTIGQIIIAFPSLFDEANRTEWDIHRLKGIVFAILSGIFRSIGFLLIPVVDKEVPHTVSAAYTPFLSMLLSIPFLPFGFPREFRLALTGRELLLFLGASTDTLNHILAIRAIQLGPAIKASILYLTRVVLMMLLGVCLRSEEFGLAHLLGSALILTSIALVLFKKTKKNNIESIQSGK